MAQASSKMVYPISQRKIHINKFIFNAYVFMTIANFALFFVFTHSVRSTLLSKFQVYSIVNYMNVIGQHISRTFSSYMIKLCAHWTPTSQSPFPLAPCDHHSTFCFYEVDCFRCLIQVEPWASLVAETVKNLPAVQETWGSIPVLEDPLEQTVATHSRILAWRISTDREAWQATSYGVAKSQTQLSD